jgi:hypothetical protein
MIIKTSDSITNLSGYLQSFKIMDALQFITNVLGVDGADGVKVKINRVRAKYFLYDSMEDAWERFCFIPCMVLTEPDATFTAGNGTEFQTVESLLDSSFNKEFQVTFLPWIYSKERTYFWVNGSSVIQANSYQACEGTIDLTKMFRKYCNKYFSNVASTSKPNLFIVFVGRILTSKYYEVFVELDYEVERQPITWN